MTLVPSEKENEDPQIKLMSSLTYSSIQALEILENNSEFRKFLDQNEGARRQARNQEHTNNSARINCRDFDSWREVPENFKTRNQWLKAGRKVQDDETAKA